MGAGTLKQIIVELTRRGCQVEALRHEPTLITFRSPHGARCSLAGSRDEFRLAREVDFSLPVSPASFHSLHDAIRAACTA